MQRPTWLDDDTRSEAELSELVLEDLKSHGWGVVDREAWGTHRVSNTRLRVDAVLEPPHPEQWHVGSQRFAFEAKKPLSGDSKDHAALIVQAVDYRHTDWDDFGHLPIIVWPEPFGTFLGGEDSAGGAVVRAILSQLNVLPLRWIQGHGWWLGKNLTRAWSSAYGPTSHAASWDLRPRWGHQ